MRMLALKNLVEEPTLDLKKTTWMGGHDPAHLGERHTTVWVPCAADPCHEDRASVLGTIGASGCSCSLCGWAADHQVARAVADACPWTADQAELQAQSDADTGSE